MDYEFFENLSDQCSKEFLDQFLTLGRQNVDLTLAQATQEGVLCDYSISSLAPILKWASQHVSTETRPPDESLPEWVRGTESYVRSLFDFDEQSSIIILRLSYYWGETFVKNFKHLQWSVGDLETVQQNMPVVVGFRNDMELAPILVVENLVRRIVENPTQANSVDIAVQTWLELT